MIYRSSSLFVTLVLGTIPIVNSVARAQGGTAATPPEVVARFLSAITSHEIDEAIRLTAPVQGLGSDSVRDDYNHFAEVANAKPLPQIIAHLQYANVAVVVIRESTEDAVVVDLDPVYLLRSKGNWLVLFGLTRFNEPYHVIDESTVANFRRIQTWYDRQETELQTMLKQQDH